MPSPIRVKKAFPSSSRRRGRGPRRSTEPEEREATRNDEKECSPGRSTGAAVSRGEPAEAPSRAS
eukprot:2243226-Alexandrium_andersonii.AAC.1